MTTMIAGELLNFVGKYFISILVLPQSRSTHDVLTCSVGYTFAPAILITPLGALSVIIG